MGADAGREHRLSLLIELEDRPGALEAALHPFSRAGVNLTHIESRPVRNGRFDFYVDCEGRRGDPAVEAVIRELKAISDALLILDQREVPWFPRQVFELDRCASHTLDAGAELEAEHPGFSDPDYRQRRAMFARIASAYRHGDPLPRIDYSADEVATWRSLHGRLTAAHARWACSAYRRAFADMEAACGCGPDRVPQLAEVSAFLQQRTGFSLRPAAGLQAPRDFLNALAFRVFFATQYLRHHSAPFYTPEPDLCHELIGHAPMFADAAFADLSQEIGLASLGATDAEIGRLARCYWFSVEFGLLREAGALKAYGAGLLSSFGELEYACSDASPAEGGQQPACRPWNPAEAAEQDYPITTFQPLYYVAESLQDAKARMAAHCRDLPRPFHARYHPATASIWVDRAVRRQPCSG